MDAWNGTISSWNSFTLDYKVVMELSGVIDMNPVYGIMIHDTSVYISVWGRGELYMMSILVDEENGLQLMRNELYISDLSEDLMFSLASRHQDNQPSGTRKSCPDNSFIVRMFINDIKTFINYVT